MPNKNLGKWSAFQKLTCTAITKDVGTRMRVRWRHWEKYKGPTWVVNRSKAIYDIAKLLRCGKVEAALEVARMNSIGVGSTGIPRGVEGVAVRQFVSTNKPSVLKRAALVLRAYTAIVLPQTTKSQWDKAVKNISGPPMHEWATMPIMDLEFERHWDMQIPSTWKAQEKLNLLPLRLLSGTSRYPALPSPGRQKINKENPYESMVASLLTKGVVPKVLVDYYGSSPFLREQAEQYQLSHEEGSPTYGNIVVLQEGGAKARTICSPNAWVQYYMLPLHCFLMQILKRVEGNVRNQRYGLSCVLDQTSGVYHLEKVLEAGGFTASVDLSAATDRFPLALQTTLLKKLGLEEFARAFIELKGPYRTPDGGLINYETGQPMGVYGSFPLFHLTHLVVLRGLCRRLQLDKDQIHFCVLGDDVIFFTEKLHVAYRDFIKTRCSVDISEHKSYQGGVCEFAGFLGFPIAHEKPVVFRPYKWGKNFQFSSELNVLHALGHPVTKWGNKWKTNYMMHATTRDWRFLDLSPIFFGDDSKPVSTNNVSENWLVALDSKIRSIYQLPPTMGTPLVYSAETEDFLLRVQLPKYRLPPRPSHFDPELYRVEEDARKKKDSIRTSFTSDPLISALMKVWRSGNTV